MKKTAILLAQGFEEVEALTPADLLRRAGIQCDLVSLDGKSTVQGSHGISIGADLAYADTDFDSYDGVILPGGMPGTTRLKDDPRVAELLRRFFENGKLTAAICAAPTVLGKAGILAGKTAVCYPGMEDGLTGASVGSHTVERDGTVLTSRGMGTAMDFGLALVAYLAGAEQAEALAKAVVYR